MTHQHEWDVSPLGVLRATSLSECVMRYFKPDAGANADHEQYPLPGTDHTGNDDARPMCHAQALPRIESSDALTARFGVADDAPIMRWRVRSTYGDKPMRRGSDQRRHQSRALEWDDFHVQRTRCHLCGAT